MHSECGEGVKIILTGSPGTIYENENFHLSVKFGKCYPMESPTVVAILSLMCLIYLSTEQASPEFYLDNSSLQIYQVVFLQDKAESVDIPVHPHIYRFLEFLDNLKLAFDCKIFDLNDCAAVHLRCPQAEALIWHNPSQ